ncbi:AAA family ATPase [Undibacterium sp. Di24W]|uniref:AAA family ATPase n=1 Tax=Undibacterium sp. Di24W TaxID=3413033 RepID=UPI003BF2C56D
MQDVMKNKEIDLQIAPVNRIAILGAESSGKSQLAQALATHFKTLWVAEYLREFVDKNGRVPCSNDQLLIAKTQMERENAAANKASTWLFCDTTPMMTALYSRLYFDELDPALSAMDLIHNYQFTVVTAPDFPWTPDGLQRESPQVRQQVHEELISILDDREIPFMLVEGSLDSRVQQVRFALDFLT